MKIQNYQEVWDIWLSSKDRLYLYMLSRFQDEEFAKDITQEVLLKIHKSCCSNREINNINSWLYQIAHNTALDHIKKSKKDLPFFSEEEDNSLNTWTELSLFLEPLMGCLPESYSIPLKMSDIDGIKQQDIANQLGISLTATKSRIQRARKNLKEQIRTCYHIEMDKNGTPISFELKNSCSLKTTSDKKI
ncbi:sigma-70 family RNA polymerase sigma factor [Pseudotenacibaculum sp. MALMAid0570]|uniref:sigma-70 family RNA polymerase sigma factor n=1 Tax=Pseudotenacibaculum sp. MALMAid0570 TaxID=3143938 RepID=UPI0032E04690